MNKRQYKKSRKKVNRVATLDEFFLLDYTPEEHQNYLEDIEEYSYRHHRYKHYKDKKSGVIDFNYHPPMSKHSEYLENILKCVRKFPVTTYSILEQIPEQFFTYINEDVQKEKMDNE